MKIAANKTMDGFCLNQAQPGTVKSIRTWKEVFRSWTKGKAREEVIEDLGIGPINYRKYRALDNTTFPEGENRVKLYTATSLPCFDPKLQATRMEISGILKDEIPYGAEGWQDALREWISEKPKGRAARTMSKELRVKKSALDKFLSVRKINI